MKINRLIIIAILTIILMNIDDIKAQKIEQSGWVTQINSGSKPLSNVEIDFNESVPTTTDNEGKFILSFQGKHKGDNILLKKIVKPGYEVVNFKEVLVTTLSSEDLKIVMCENGLIDEMRLIYYNISINAINNNYEKKHQNLQLKLEEKELEQEQYQKQIKELYTQYQNIEKNAMELAQKYACTNFDDVSSIYKEAFEAFKNGQIEETISILEKVDLIDRLQNRMDESSRLNNLSKEFVLRKNENNLGIKQDMSAIQLAAEMYTLKFDYDKAEEMYLTLWSLDTTNFDNSMGYAEFLDDKQSKYEKTLIQYQKAMPYASDVLEEVLLFNRIGSVHMKLNNYSEAKQTLEHVLELHISKEDPSVLLASLASTYNLLGIIQMKKLNYKDAINFFKRGLDLLSLFSESFDILLQSDPTYQAGAYTFEKRIALQSNMASAYIDLQNFYKAEELLTQSYGECLFFMKRDSLQYIPLLAGLYSSFGYVKREANDNIEAVKYYSKAHKIYESLAEKDKYVYSANLADISYQLGSCFYNLQRYSDSKDMLQQSEIVYKTMSEHTPIAFSNEIADVYNLMGATNKILKDYQATIYSYNESIKIYKALAKDNPQVYSNELSQALTNIAITYIEYFEYEKALFYYREALDVKKYLSELHPLNIEYKEDIARTLASIAEIYRHYNNIEMYKSYLSKTAEVWMEIYETTKEEMHKEYASLFYNLISDVSIEHKEKIIKIEENIKKLMKNDKSMKRDELLFHQYINKAWYSIMNKEFANAEQAIELALQYKSLVGVGVAKAYVNLAHVYLFQNRYEEAKKLYLEYKDKIYYEGSTMTCEHLFIQDLEEFKKANLMHPDIDRVIILLNQ